MHSANQQIMNCDTLIDESDKLIFAMPPIPHSPASSTPSSMGIELIELETFIAVAQEGSFSAAAIRLHVSQPTVTGRIQRLESMLGTPLLRRTTRKVETTPQGAQLLQEAVQALAGLSQLVHGFRQKMRQSRQRVVVATTPILAALSMPPVIHGYMEKYPDVEVELLDLHYAEVLAALENGTADIGILALEGEDPRYRFQVYWSDDMLLAVPHSHPLARVNSIQISELARHTLIMIGQHQGLRSRIASALHQLGLNLPPSRVVGNLSTVLGMLEAGMGVTILSRSMAARGDFAKYAMAEITGVDLKRDFGVVTSKRKVLSTSEQSFCRYLKQALPQMLAGEKKEKI